MYQLNIEIGVDCEKSLKSVIHPMPQFFLPDKNGKHLTHNYLLNADYISRTKGCTMYALKHKCVRLMKAVSLVAFLSFCAVTNSPAVCVVYFVILIEPRFNCKPFHFLCIQFRCKLKFKKKKDVSGALSQWNSNLITMTLTNRTH